MQHNEMSAAEVEALSDMLQVIVAGHEVGEAIVEKCALLMFNHLVNAVGTTPERLSGDTMYVIGLLAGYYGARSGSPGFGSLAVRAGNTHALLLAELDKNRAALEAQVEKNLMAAVGQPVTEQ